MFEPLKEKALVWAANKTEQLLLPDDKGHRDIAESMFMEGAAVVDINQTSLLLWQEKRRNKPRFLSDKRPLGETKNGPLQPQTVRKYR